MKDILFVDDEPNFLNGIRRMLRKDAAEWQFHAAYSVDEALEQLAKNRFHVVVCDVQMPEKTGFDLLKVMQQDETISMIPVIILTGSTDDDMKHHALDLGATDLLNKPVNIDELRARLRSAIRIYDYQQEILQQNAVLEQRVRQRTRELELSRIDIIWRLAKAGEFRDEETGNHVMRVAWGSAALARTLGLDEEQVEQIFMASPLHDIGKIGIPDQILLKPGRLTDTERLTMERHCDIGAAILREPPKNLPEEYTQELGAKGNVWLNTAADIALHHHERWDGTGYPNRVKGGDIPLAGQIVAAADVYDALRSERSYKPSWECKRVVALMETLGGTHFSDAIVQGMLATVDEFERIRKQYAG